MNSIKLNFKYFLFSFLVISLPFIFILKNFVINFYLFIFIFFLFNYNFRSVIFQKKFLLLWFFYLVCIASSAFSDFPLYSLKSSLPFIRFLFFSIALSFIFLTDERYFKYFIYSILFVLICLTLDSFYQQINGYNILGYEYKDPRTSSFFGNELIMGGYLKSFLPIIAGYFLITYNENKLIKNIFIIAVLMFGILLIIMSGERTAVIQIFLFILILYLSIGIRKKYINIFLITIIIFSSSIILLNEKFRHRLIRDTLVHMGFDDKEVKTFKYISIIHTNFYKAGFKIFNDNKLIGVGPKNFRNVCDYPKYRIIHKKASEQNNKKIFYNTCSTHPHNFYLQALSETGSIGFLSLVSFFLFVSYKIISYAYNKNFKNKENLNIYVFLMYLSIFINIFPLAPSGSLFSTYLGTLLFLPLAIINYFQNKKLL